MQSEVSEHSIASSDKWRPWFNRQRHTWILPRPFWRPDRSHPRFKSCFFNLPVKHLYIFLSNLFFANKACVKKFLCDMLLHRSEFHGFYESNPASFGPNRLCQSTKTYRFPCGLCWGRLGNRKTRSGSSICYFLKSKKYFYLFSR